MGSKAKAVSLNVHGLEQTPLPAIGSDKANLRMRHGERAVLQPGMSAPVEIVTGKRRLIELLLYPIACIARTTGRERRRQNA